MRDRSRILRASAARHELSGSGCSSSAPASCGDRSPESIAAAAGRPGTASRDLLTVRVASGVSFGGDAVADLLSMHFDLSRSINTDADLVALRFEDDDYDVFPDPDRLADSSRQK
jgi:hypothetical protein